MDGQGLGFAMRTLSRRVEGGGQTVDYIEHIELGRVMRDGVTEHKCRIKVHDDSHASQAFAMLERWNGSEWREVVSVRGDAMRTEHGIGYRMKDGDPKPFQRDRDRLIDLAMEILR